MNDEIRYAYIVREGDALVVFEDFKKAIEYFLEPIQRKSIHLTNHY